MQIDLLNHASILITFNSGIKFLFDPWFEGNVFEEGWGLKYSNPEAIDLVADCNFLWISHFHVDHFHIPTLKNILDINPNITVFENNSYNFRFKPVLKKIGFKNIISLSERDEYKINDELSLERYPTTGIDNMLFIRSNEANILNYNDCNIPIMGRKMLSKKLNKIDILLSNFNHGGKLLHYPKIDDNYIKEESVNNFLNTIKSFDPKYTIPFASFHYYRAPESLDQNASLMNTTDLNKCHKSIIEVNIGDRIRFNNTLLDYKIEKVSNVTINEKTVKNREKQVSLNEIQKSATIFCRKINKSLFYFSFWVPSLFIKITDLNLVCRLKVSKNCIKKYEVDEKHVHISCTSQELNAWLSKLYGTDGFTIGAHFSVTSDNIFPFKIIILLGLLVENKLDFKSLLKMLFSFRGLRFYWNRREEITSILLTKNFLFGIRK
tara:strand:- start:503 stop:1810 length:1308 start_codon:yes stop_codon:yes gene_type:complete